MNNEQMDKNKKAKPVEGLKPAEGLGANKPESTNSKMDQVENGFEIKAGAMVFAKTQTGFGAMPGKQVGRVDHLDGESYIKLDKKSSPDGQHRWIPTSWVDKIDEKGVYLNKTEEEFKSKVFRSLPQEEIKKAV